MKKIYMKPEMQVHQIRKTGILLTSGKGVYGNIKKDGVITEEQALKYGGYVTEDDEDEFDPD